MSLTNYPRLFAKSALYHAVIIIVFIALMAVSRFWQPEPVHVFELVAGAGDNYLATEAPAAAPAPTVASPVIPVVPPRSTPPVPAPPVQTAPKVQATPAPTPAPKSAPKVETAPVVQPLPIISQEEFLKDNPQKSQPATPPRTQQKIERIDTSADQLRQGASTAAGAGGTAQRVNNVDARNAFDALLRQRLRENLVRPAGLSLTLEADARIQVARDGKLTGTLSRSSGNATFDQAVRDAIARTVMPNPPSGYDSAVSVTFRMRDESQ